MSRVEKKFLLTHFTSFDCMDDSLAQNIASELTDSEHHDL